MIAPQQLSKFDPFRMTDELVRGVATGRETQVAHIMRVIAENLAAHDTPPQHLAVVAPRGTGKTFLLRLIGLEIESFRADGGNIAFLHMPEEMPAILSPASLMREILVRFQRGRPEENDLKWRSDDGEWDELVASMDTAVTERFGIGEGLLVLCLENIQDIIDAALSRDLDQRRFRAWLDRPESRIMLIAASANGAFDDDYEKPLFRVAATIPLGRWSIEETLLYLDRVMLARRGVGLDDAQRAKAKAIAAFTGGSPRMAAALAEIATADDVLTAAQTLSGLVDNLNDYYHWRLRDMGADARRCIDKLLREGENISQSELARRLGVLQPVVAQAFKGLLRKNILVSERPAGSKEKLYRVADRVFAHFYRVRVLDHGRDVCILEPIVELLVDAFSDTQRASEAARMFQRGLSREAHVLLGTLTRLDPATAEEHWWFGVEIRTLVRDIRQIAIRKNWSMGPWFDGLGALLATPANAMPIAEQMLREIDGSEGKDLRHLTAGLAFLAAGHPDAARDRFDALAAREIAKDVRCVVIYVRAFAHLEKLASDEANQDLQEVFDLAKSIGDAPVQARAARGLGYCASFCNDHDKEYTFHRQAADLSEASGDHIGLSRARKNLAICSMLRGDLAQALSWAEAAYESAAASGNIAERADKALALADVLSENKAFAVGLERAQEAATLARAADEPAILLGALDREASVHSRLGHKSDVLSTARALGVAARDSGSAFLTAVGLADSAWHLAHSALDLEANVAAEATAAADEALTYLQPNQYRSYACALSAKIWAAAGRGNYQACLDAAEQLLPYARQANDRGDIAEALEYIIYALVGIGRHSEAAQRGVAALTELASAETRFIGTEATILSNVIRSLRALDRLGDVKEIAEPVWHYAVEGSHDATVATLASNLLPVAFETGAFAWAWELADQSLPTIAAQSGTSNVAGSLIAAITAADKWAETAPRVPDTIWPDAADSFSGTATSLALARLAEHEPSAAFAGFNGLLTTIAPDIDAANDPTSPRLKLLRQILTASAVVNWPAGLLTDIASAVGERLPRRLEAETRMLREIARFNAAGQDPALLPHIAPDVAEMLRLVLPHLAPPAPTEGPKSTKPRKRKTPPRR